MEPPRDKPFNQNGKTYEYDKTETFNLHNKTWERHIWLCTKWTAHSQQCNARSPLMFFTPPSQREDES